MKLHYILKQLKIGWFDQWNEKQQIYLNPIGKDTKDISECIHIPSTRGGQGAMGRQETDLQATFSNSSFILIWELHDDVMNGCLPSCLIDLFDQPSPETYQLQWNLKLQNMNIILRPSSIYT